MYILGIAGYSGSGKTTLIEALLPELRRRGLSVSVIKQSHHDIAMDTPGKDSWRHRAAGAQEVILTTPHRFMLVHELGGAPEPGLDDLAARLAPCDLVLAEGFRHAALPKIEVWRTANGKPWLHPADPQVIAIASDAPAPAPTPPRFDLDDPKGLAAFIVERLN